LRARQWLYRDATGTNWQSTRLHDAIGIDSSFGTPGTDTKTWWERDPFNNIQSWGNAASTYMTINAGKVGIGTSSPEHKLEVDGRMRVLSATGANPSSGTGLEMMYYDAADIGYIFAYNRTASAYKNLSLGDTASPLFLNANGNVGIGTTSSGGKLNVNGGVVIGLGAGVNTTDGGRRSLQILTDTSYGGTYDSHTGFLIYSTMPGGWGTAKLHFTRSTNWATYDSTPTMTLSGSNVGIGTTSPSKKFEVNGTAGAFNVDPDNSGGPLLNTTSGNMTITSAEGSVIIRLG